MEKEEFAGRNKIFCDFDFGRFREMRNERKYWERKEKREKIIEENRKNIDSFFDRIWEVTADKMKIQKMLREVEGGEEKIDYDGFLLILRYLMSDGYEEIREICIFLLVLYSNCGRIPYEYLSSFDIIGCFYRVLESFEFMEEVVGWYLEAIGNFFFSYQELVLKEEITVFLFKIIEFSQDCSDFILDKCYFIVSSMIFWEIRELDQYIKIFLLDGLCLTCLKYETTERLLLCINKKISEFTFVNNHIDQLVNLIVSEISVLDSLSINIIIDAFTYFNPDELLNFGILERLNLAYKGKFKRELLGIYLNLLWNSQVFIKWLIEFKSAYGALEFLLVESEDVVLRVLVFLIKSVEVERIMDIVVELGVISSVCILLGENKVDVIDKCLDLLYLLRNSEIWQEELEKYQGYSILEKLIYHKNLLISQKSEILFNMLKYKIY